MKLTYNWLLEHLSENLTIEEVKTALDNLSIEIDHINKIGGAGYVVGKILTFTPYGEKLKICQIAYKNENNILMNKEVICGAPNVVNNMSTILALENTQLPNGLILKEKNINGFLSSGMCLSYEEFGLPHLTSTGIIDESEEFLQEIVKEDYIINISIPANRVDISSIYGLATEIANYYKIAVKSLHKENVNYNLKPSMEIVCNKEACENFSTVQINNIKIKDNYEKIKSLLSKISDINPIPLVNIGNYITRDLGIPLHIYNKDTINKLTIDFATHEDNDKKFLTLQNQEVIIKKNDILIKNENNEIIVLAGLIGGDKYKITHDTSNILIEVGIFNKKHLIPTSNRLNINTESSYFFKRGINYNNYLLALNYINNFIDGDYSKINLVINTPKIVEPIFLSYKDFYKKTHEAMSLDTISNKLKQYKYQTEVYNKPTDDLNNDMGLMINPPLYKCHIDSAASIIEDIIRINNNKINKELIAVSLGKIKESLDEVFYENTIKIKEYLVNMGLEEVITYSFSEKGHIELINPIVSAEKFLRDSLQYHIKKHLINLIKNKAYVNNNYGVFEISKVFHKKDKITEHTNLSIGLIKNTYHININNMENFLKNILVNIGLICNLKIEIRHMNSSENKDINKVAIYINGLIKGYGEFYNEYMILEIENLESIIKKEIKPKARIYEDNLDYTTRDYSFFTNKNYDDIEKSLYKIKNINFCLLDLFKNNESKEVSYTIRFKLLQSDLDIKDKEILDIFNKMGVILR